MTWESPYGKPGGIVGRLVKLESRLRTDRSLPWFGTGIIEDLRAVIQVLNKREWLERMRLCDDREAQEFAAEVLDDVERLEYVDDAADQSSAKAYDLVEAIKELDAAALDYRAVRDVLVECGALDDNDTETPVADLLRALLA